MRVKIGYLFISLVGVLALCNSGVFAGTYHVALDGSGDFTSIRAAVEEAVDGDYVVIHPGFYTGYTEIETDQNIVVKSIDPNDPEVVEQTVIFGLPDPYHFIDSQAETLTVEGLTFSGFYGINIIRGYCDDMLIRNCVFRDICFLGSGVPIFSRQCNTTIENCVFRRIKPTSNFGESNLIRFEGYFSSSYSCQIKNCIFAENELSVCSSNDIINSMIYASYNTALTIENCTITNNIFFGDINNAYNYTFIVDGFRSPVTIKNSIVWGNIAQNCNILSFASCDPDASFSVDYSDIEGGEAEAFYFPSYGAVVDLYFNGTIPNQNSVPDGVINWGTNNIETDPLFVRLGDDGGDGWVDLTTDVDESVNNMLGDYHLKSQYGRYVWEGFSNADFNMDRFVNILDFSYFANNWQLMDQHQWWYASNKCDLNSNWNIDVTDLALFCNDYLQNRMFGEWLNDAITSPCIDTGDPSDTDWQYELLPHGGRINMGAYGGTPEASMSD